MYSSTTLSISRLTSQLDSHGFRNRPSIKIHSPNLAIQKGQWEQLISGIDFCLAKSYNTHSKWASGNEVVDCDDDDGPLVEIHDMIKSFQREKAHLETGFPSWKNRDYQVILIFAYYYDTLLVSFIVDFYVHVNAFFKCNRFQRFQKTGFQQFRHSTKNVGFIFESASRTNSKENSMWPFANYVNQILRIFNQGSSVNLRLFRRRIIF